MVGNGKDYYMIHIHIAVTFNLSYILYKLDVGLVHRNKKCFILAGYVKCWTCGNRMRYFVQSLKNNSMIKCEWKRICEMWVARV